MSLPGLNLENLPEPVRNLLQNIDPGALAQLATVMDPNTVMEFLNNTLSSVRQSMKPEEAAIFDQVLNSLRQAMQSQKK
ncbi:MAG: hypothetical protein AB1523_05575 [Bacillota bacterium]